MDYKGEPNRHRVKFSHRYKKFKTLMGADLLIGSDPQLLEVFNTTKKELGKTFIDYDTETTEGDFYNLPDGKLLVLLLRTPRGLFTTIRRYTPQKEEYYRGFRGFVLGIDIMSNMNQSNKEVKQ